MNKFLRAINPIVWIQSYIAYRRRKQSDKVFEFTQNHKDLVFIVLFPGDDAMYMSYHGKYAYNRIKTTDGQRQNVVRGVMKAGQFKSKIDLFLVAILEIMKAPLTNESVQHFIKWVDGATFAIGRRLQSDKVDQEFAQFVSKEKDKIINKQ